MREIKFRAWDKKHNEMSEVFDLWRILTHNQRYAIAENPETMVLMQYTNVKDKSKKEIYDSDIVKYFRKDSLDSKPKTMYVYWDIAGASFKLAHNYKLISSHNYSLEYSYLSYDVGKLCLEIIGNIYENPELLD